MDINVIYAVKFTERGMEISYDDEAFDSKYEQLVASSSSKIAKAFNDGLSEIPNDVFYVECKIDTNTHTITNCNVDVTDLTKNKLH